MLNGQHKHSVKLQEVLDLRRLMRLPWTSSSTTAFSSNLVLCIQTQSSFYAIIRVFMQDLD